MENQNDWNRFTDTGKVEDYLEFVRARNRSQELKGYEDARLYERDGDGSEDGTYR